jgi:glycosyltransferase involved in cell wall biosynthesis
MSDATSGERRPEAPTVSVVVPCYNYARFLPDAVTSALSQDGVDVDVIIVDDASTDDSVAVATALAAADSRIRVLAHEKNWRHIATYNHGFAHVTGEYTVMLSADDMLAPGALRRATQLMIRHPNVGLVYGFAPPFSSVPPAPRPVKSTETVWRGADWVGRVTRLANNPIRHPEVVMRSDVLKALGGYDPDMPHSADLDFWLRAAVRADVGRVNGADQAYYRVHEDQMHLTTYAGTLFDLRARLGTYDTFLSGDGRRLGSGDELRARVHWALAREALRSAAAARDAALDDDTQDLVTDLREFARETYPGIVKRRAWRTTGMARPPRTRVVERHIDHVRRSLLWHRWRRYGL